MKRYTWLVIAIFYCLAISPVFAQDSVQTDEANMPSWAVTTSKIARGIKDPQASSPQSTGVFPSVIPKFLPSDDPSGIVETFNSVAPTDTSTHAFFKSLGTNGRACATCHEPRSSWTVSTDSLKQRFNSSKGTDPIFRLVDGATCPTDRVDTLGAKREAYKLLLSHGLIRVFLPVPADQLGTNTPRNYKITVEKDPYGCTDLSADPPMVSVYRRPLLSANMRFLIECPPGVISCPPLSIMSDGREPSLDSQAKDATLIHAQADKEPTADQITEIVDFETRIYDAQVRDNLAGRLDDDGANGGPFALSQQNFYIGINDVLGGDPLAPKVFNPNVFTLYTAWQNFNSSTYHHDQDAARASIARGEVLFNTKPFTISGVNGLNLFASDPLGTKDLTTGTCTVCHDSPNVGNHSLKLPINIGTSDANPPILDVSKLPVFKIACTDEQGPLKDKVFYVNDPGKALISGNCADAGKVKGPILRGLAARAPYFHNGSAATLKDAVDFYDKRFNINFTEQEKSDLVAFLKTL